MDHLARAVAVVLLVAVAGCGDDPDFPRPIGGGRDAGDVTSDGAVADGGSGGGGSRPAGTGGSGGSGSGGSGSGGSGSGGSGSGGAGGDGAGSGGSGGDAGDAGPGSGGADAATGLALDCDHLVCDAPAECEVLASGGAHCVCPAGYDDVAGDGSDCVDLDECADGTHDCDANATCDNTAGGFDCTCNAGYEGDGKTCTDIDECAGDPCGMGVCRQNAPGQGYRCTCRAGQTMVDGVCVCDLSGVFAVRITTDVSWSNVDNVEDGAETTHSWALRTQTYDTDGTLTIETRPCGGTSPDICTPRIPFVKPENEAHAQFFPNAIWDLPTMPVQVQTVSIPDALPTRPFVLPHAASLLGMELDDPMGAWPASRYEVGGAGATNGARWADHDDNGVAVLSRAVPPGTDSAVCPRGSSGARWPYAYWPGLDGATFRRVMRFRVGSRVISGMDGTIVSCDRIEGAVNGPDGGKMLSEARVQGCIRVEGSGSVQCEPDLVDFFDGQDQVQQIDSASFVMVRVADDAVCADARRANFD